MVWSIQNDMRWLGANIRPRHIRDSSILRFWYPRRVLELIPCEYCFLIFWALGLSMIVWKLATLGDRVAVERPIGMVVTRYRFSQSFKNMNWPFLARNSKLGQDSISKIHSVTPRSTSPVGQRTSLRSSVPVLDILWHLSTLVPGSFAWLIDVMARMVPC